LGVCRGFGRCGGSSPGVRRRYAGSSPIGFLELAKSSLEVAESSQEGCQEFAE
ncbi:hypothetical protein GW17_00048749, partial [Ensete ventricosum]